MSTTAMVPVHDTSDQPPHDYQAEQSCLGGMMLSPTAIDAVFDVVEVEDFWSQKHQAIAGVIRTLHADGTPCDPITVSAELDRGGDLARCGGAPYLHTLIATVPTAENAAYYAEIVREKATKRRAGEVGTHLQQLSAGSAVPESFIPSALAAVEELAERSAPRARTSAKDDVTGVMQRLEDIAAGRVDPSTVPTGFVDFDDVIGGGVSGGQLVTVAGLTGAGKSTLMVDFARSCAFKHGRRVLYVSQEMAKPELWMRILSAEARIRFADMRSGRMSDGDWSRLARRVGELSDEVHPGVTGLDLMHLETYLTPSQVATHARRMQRESAGLAMIVIDYLQITQPDATSPVREQEVAQMTRQFKLLAGMLGVPVVIGSQFNRGPAERDDKRPRVSDLRESGAIEQDSDLIVMLHRPDQHNRDDARAGEADLIIGKHRNGPTSTIAVAHQLHYSRFADLAQE